MGTVTLKELAAKLDLSITTVSRALAGYSDVAESTRQRVLEAAEEMGYVPDATARRLRKGRTDTIGLIVPTYKSRFSDPYFAEFLAGLGNKAVELEYDLLVSTRPPGPEEIRAYKRMISERRVDGLLIISTRMHDARIMYLLERNFPFVSFGRTNLTADFPYLDVDGEAGMRKATQHLIDLGHRHIAYISGPLDFMYTNHRLAGYKRGLVSNDIVYDESLVAVGDFTEQSGYELGLKFLAQNGRPTAIVACSDAIASGAISAAQEVGLKVGRDVALTGFDDIPPAEHTRPSMTTVRQPAYEAGWRVCEMLVRLVRGEELTRRQILLKPELVIRQSSGAL